MRSPPAPDYAAAAREQGAANEATARFNAIANRPQEYTPWGNRIWTADPNNPDRSVVTTTLSPEEQRLYGLSTGLQAQGLEALQRAFPQIDAALQGNYSLPGTGMTGLDRSFLAPGGIAQDMAAGLANVPPLQTSVDFNATGANLPTADLQTRQMITDALYRQQREMLDPQFEQLQAQEAQRLTNQGLQPGSEAYRVAMENFGRTRQNAYEGARNLAITGGGEEMARDFGLGLSRRQQASSEALQSGNFRNAANAQQFAQDLARYQFWNQAQAQGFNQALASSQLSGTQREQALREMMAARTMPLNVFNALLTQGQVQGPNLQPYNNNIQAQAAPLFDASLAQGQYNLSQANAQNALWGNILSGLSSAGTAYWLRSDRRLKSNILRVGTSRMGLPLYEYDLAGERYLGVMSDDVRVIAPHAVRVDADGFDEVNYAEIE